MPPLTTAQTMTSADLPKGRGPDEFLTDADLVGYHQRALDALASGDGGVPGAERALRMATRAAWMTQDAIEAAEATARAEEAAAAPPPKGAGK